MISRIAVILFSIFTSTSLVPEIGMAGNGQSIMPLALGGLVGAMQQMQQRQYRVQHQQEVARQQAATAWAQLGSAVLGYIAQNYQIDGPQFGRYHIVFPSDGDTRVSFGNVPRWSHRRRNSGRQPNRNGNDSLLYNNSSDSRKRKSGDN